MKITIKQDKILADIQKDFHTVFPYLKIEFFDKNHTLQQPENIVANTIDCTVAEVRNTNMEGDLTIEGAMTVAEVEKKFMEEFDLAVQIYRRSGDLWLKTTTTDDLTLKQQNTSGSLSVKKDSRKEPEDYRLSDK